MPGASRRKRREAKLRKEIAEEISGKKDEGMTFGSFVKICVGIAVIYWIFTDGYSKLKVLLITP